MTVEAPFVTHAQKKEEDAAYRRMGAIPSAAASAQLLQVISALNLVRMNLGMYPPGHLRITESVDHTFDMVQKILGTNKEWLVGLAGDTLTFGETAPEKEKKNAAFREYARCLNALRIVSFTLHRGLKKEELLEFNRILSAKPADIWAMGKIESVFARAGIKNIAVKVIDADHFRVEEKKEILQPKIERKVKNDQFWEEFFVRLKLESSMRDGVTTDQVKIDPVEAIRLINKQREHWPSAVSVMKRWFRVIFPKYPKGERSVPRRMRH